jgi:hypothetical protein
MAQERMGWTAGAATAATQTNTIPRGSQAIHEVTDKRMSERRNDSCVAREMPGASCSQRVGLLPRHPRCIGIDHSSSLVSPFIPEKKGKDDENMRYTVVSFR